MSFVAVLLFEVALWPIPLPEAAVVLGLEEGDDPLLQAVAPSPATNRVMESRTVRDRILGSFGWESVLRDSPS